MTTPEERPDARSSAPASAPRRPLFTVRVQLIIGVALLVAVDMSLLSNALATRSGGLALLAAGVTVAWLAVAALAWRSQ